MRTHKTLVKSVAIASALAVTFTLSACFTNPLDTLTDKISEGVAQGGAEKLIEGVTGSKMDIETGKLPADFPAEIPTLDGAIQTAFGMEIDDGKTWSVVIAVDDAQTAMATAREKFLSAGFEETLWNDADVMTMGMFSNDNYSVIISGMFSDDDEQTLSYQVIENAPDE